MRVKGVIVAAGYGTRFLPVTKVVPKELLPIVNRPAIDYVVSEFINAGITDILLISSRRKRGLEDWFDHDIELDSTFRREGNEKKLAAAAPPKVNLTVVRQQSMQGTGHALLHAKDFAGTDPVVVAFPDDLFGEPNATAQLIARHKQAGCSVLAAADLSGSDVSRYGVMDTVERDDGAVGVRRVVEKPSPGSEPSSLISLGRYLYTPEIFERLAVHYEQHSGGEYYPMAAMDDLGAAGRLVCEVLQAPRYDTGAPLGYLQAVVELGMKHPEHGRAFEAWLTERFTGR